MNFWTLIDFLGELMVSYGVKVILAIVILLFGLWLIRVCMRKLSEGKLLKHMDESLRSFLISVIRIALFAVLFISVAGIVGIPTASFLTLLASAGVAIGLAVQGALSNFAGGVMLLIFKPFKVGDFVETGGGSGTVESITVFYTMLKTPDNCRITLPNGSITNANITNFSSYDTRRVDLVFMTGGGADIDQVKSLLLELAASHPNVLDDPAPFCRMTGQKDGAMEFTLRAFTESVNYWDVKFDLNESAKKAFSQKGIKAALPQLDVHLPAKEA